jgi:hypothetical protein
MLKYFYHLAPLAAAISIKANEVGLPTSTQDIGQGFANAVKLLIGLSGSLAVVFLVVGGIQMVASAGDPKRFAQGRESVIYAVVGLIIAISAFAIVQFVGNRL